MTGTPYYHDFDAEEISYGEPPPRVEVVVGPPRLSLHQAHTILVAENDGQIISSSPGGLYFFDTRIISDWRLTINGKPWVLINSGQITTYAARIFLTNPELEADSGTISSHGLSLVLTRWIMGGIHEDIDLINFSGKEVGLTLEIGISTDFADIFEVRTGHLVERANVQHEWAHDSNKMTIKYANQDFWRELEVRAALNTSEVAFSDGRISFNMRLEPSAKWHSCLLYNLCGSNNPQGKAPERCYAKVRHSQLLANNERQQELPKIRSSNWDFAQLCAQAIDDIAGLQLPMRVNNRLKVIPAAGVPWYVALFGRDSLIASLQNVFLHPEFASDTLDVLAAFQASEWDDYRDAEPGKIPHELRLGELAHFKLIPHTPYYGTADATPLFLVVLHSAWRITGDDQLLQRHLSTAERCLTWIDHYGDRDRDGFQEYETRSAAGYENQGWKDAADAILNPDGSAVEGPKALCELQGYVFDAWIGMAEIFDELEMSARASELRAKAKDLYLRFNEKFWDPEEGFYALALDGNKRRVMTIASNPGHCLWSGIIPRDRATSVVRRLLDRDMYSGWGIRTLSARHPAYNPHSYQLGSVWPHDNAVAALGFKRYGFFEETGRVAGDVLRATSFFSHRRPPELYAGLEREETSFPVQYLGANVPQAWASGAAFAFLQALLGWNPNARKGKLRLDPFLPAWLSDLTLINLKVGDQAFDLHFERSRGRTELKVLRGDPANVERCSARLFMDC